MLEIVTVCSAPRSTDPIRVLRVHNRYQQRGGEDAVFDAEVALLRDHGLDVQALVLSNDDIPIDRSPSNTLGLAVDTVWSRAGRAQVAAAVARQNPHVVHFDNTFPRVSPAAYSPARAAGAAVVQTLHNYRLLCPNAAFYRDGHPCEDCLGHTPPLPAIVHACYRDSRPQTAAVAAMLTAHRLRRTWSRDVDRYIALTEFAQRKFIEGGLPADRIVVKPNVATVAVGARTPAPGRFLFVGRLTPEKGLPTLVDAAARLPAGISIRVAGTGPLLPVLRNAPASLTALGQLPPSHVAAEMRAATALVFPSEWYEGFPMTIAEAFGTGLPVIASRLGAMAEIVQDGKTGLHVEPGNLRDLALKIRWATDHPEAMQRMGENARREYEARYTPARNYEQLIEIYRDAIAHRHPHPG